MTAKKVSSTKKKEITKSEFITLYMEYVLEQECFPKTVYKFCKESKVEEQAFYKFFGSLDTLQKVIWNTFFSMTMDLADKNKEYEAYSSREKMLTFFYTFFELMTANRSYVLFVLQYHQGMDRMKNMMQLKDLRILVKEFASDLIKEGNDTKQFKFTKKPVHLFSEGAWLQLVFLLKFWMKDESAGFEKTDMAIEKSVNTIFDVFDHTPLDNVIDFGKFLWRETVS